MYEYICAFKKEETRMCAYNCIYVCIYMSYVYVYIHMHMDQE